MVRWAKKRISLPHAKSGRQKRPPWSRMGEANVGEDDHHDPTVGVLSLRLYRPIPCISDLDSSSRESRISSTELRYNLPRTSHIMEAKSKKQKKYNTPVVPCECPIDCLPLRSARGGFELPTTRTRRDSLAK